MINQHRPDTTAPSCVLLTGATGYIGSFLLERLLEATEAEVYCLIRARSAQEGLERIKKHLQVYRIWNDSFTTRIRPVVGDLAKPLLGLSQSQFLELAATADTIYHSGAIVNFALPYATLKGPNVLGTQEVLRLACQSKPKVVHYISTVDTLIATHVSRPYLEVDPPRRPTVTPDGYMLSKWVSEILIVSARARGVPVCIYRLPWVLSHTRTGASPTNNMLLLELKGFLELGYLPDSGDSRAYNGVPVDYAARAVIHLGKREDSLGKIFHIWNSQLVSYNQIYDWIRTFGYEFDIVPRAIALKRVRSLEPSHTLYPLTPILAEGEVRPSAHDPQNLNMYDPRIECANALKGLEGSGIECPPSDEKLVHLCLSYLIDIGFLGPPGAHLH